MKIALPTVLLLSLGFLSGCDTPPAAGEPGADAKATDAAAPEVAIQILDYDETMKLVQGQAGKVVVLDVWNTSCDPCIREFPGLVALHKKHGPDKVACVSLSLDYFGGKKGPEEVKEPVLDFLRKQGATFQNILASEETDKMLDKLEIDAPPVVIVFDQQGKIVKQFKDETGVGSFTYQDDIAPLVASLLQPK